MLGKYVCCSTHLQVSSHFWRTAETSHLGHSSLISQALGVSLAGSCFLQNQWCRNKNRLCQNLLVFLVWSWKVSDPRVSLNLSILWAVHSMCSWSSELQLPLRINVLCALNPCEDLAVKTAWSSKAFLCRRASIRMLLRLCELVIFEMLAPERLALNSFFLSVERL